MFYNFIGKCSQIEDERFVYLPCLRCHRPRTLAQLHKVNSKGCNTPCRFLDISLAVQPSLTAWLLPLVGPATLYQSGGGKTLLVGGNCSNNIRMGQQLVSHYWASFRIFSKSLLFPKYEGSYELCLDCTIVLAVQSKGELNYDRHHITRLKVRGVRYEV